MCIQGFIILNQWRYITKEINAAIVVLDEPLLDTRKKNSDLMSSLISNLILQLLSYVAEMERTMIRQRQKEGISAAKQQGKKFGRPKKDLPDDFNTIMTQLEQKKITLAKAMHLSGLKESTFYRRLKEYRKN